MHETVVERRAQPGALIIGGAHGSLAMARSLGRRGIAVDLLAEHRLVTFSRYVRRKFFWQGSGSADAAAYLCDLAHSHGLAGAVLFAGGDPEAAFIAQNHAELSAVFRLTTPPWERLRAVFDKTRMQRHAAMIGVDTPRSYRPRSPRYDHAAALVGNDGIVLQEFIPGGGEAQFSYAAAFDRGSPVASLVARRTRQYPVEFGYTSTFVETIDCPAVEEAGRRLLASLDYTGLAEVEFKFDPRDGRYKLLDVNARVWTWSALGGLVGVDFPHVMWRIARGETVTPARATRPAAWIHVSRDLVAAAQHMLAGRLSPAAYLRSLRKPMVTAAFALDDPLPGIAELPLALWRAVAHRLPIMLRDSWRRIATAPKPAAGRHVDAPPLAPAAEEPSQRLSSLP